MHRGIIRLRTSGLLEILLLVSVFSDGHYNIHGLLAYFELPDFGLFRLLSASFRPIAPPLGHRHPHGHTLLVVTKQLEREARAIIGRPTNHRP